MEIDSVGSERYGRLLMGAFAYFESIGRAVERGWGKVGHAPDCLPAIAEEVLRDTEVPSDLSATNLLDNVIRSTCLPEQHDAAARFGQPPITLWRNDKFFVAGLCWFDGTTAIHEHGFCGAFRVLEGASVHTRAVFEPARAASSHLVFGNLDLIDSEVLRVGDVRQILLGEAGIHSLFHLDEPSVTIVVRTYADKSPQYRYLRPGLAYDPDFEDASVRRRLQAMQAMQRLDQSRAFDFATHAMRGDDEWLAFCVLREWFKRRRGESFTRLLDTFDHWHRDVGSIIRDVFKHRGHEAVVTARRRSVRAPDDRLFLALLLTRPHHDVAARLLGVSPDAPHTWRTTMCEVVDRIHADGQNVRVGLPPSDEVRAVVSDTDRLPDLQATLEWLAGEIMPVGAEGMLYAR